VVPTRCRPRLCGKPRTGFQTADAGSSLFTTERSLRQGNIHENCLALVISSDAMAPAYFSGDTVVVDVELPPYLGAEVVAFNPKTSLMISGILVDHSNGSFVLRFHSPPDGVPREMTLSREEYPQCHPIVMVVRKRPP
jgi:hypothetical protein